MPITPTYGLPYPSLSDPPNGPAQFQDLAEEVEVELTRIDADVAGNESTFNDIIRGFAPPTQTGSGSLSSAAQAIIMTVSIVDPGFSYYVIAGGSIGWAMSGATQPGGLLVGAITIDSAVYNVNVLRHGHQVSHSLGAGFTQPTCVVPTTRSDVFGAFVGAKTVRLIARNSSAVTMTIPAAGLDTTLHVRIVPS